MDTNARVRELAEARDISLFQLAQLCGVSYNTLKTSRVRNNQLRVETIERICYGLGIPLVAFFDTPEGHQITSIEDK